MRAKAFSLVIRTVAVALLVVWVAIFAHAYSHSERVLLNTDYKEDITREVTNGDLVTVYPKSKVGERFAPKSIETTVHGIDADGFQSDDGTRIVFSEVSLIGRQRSVVERFWLALTAPPHYLLGFVVFIFLIVGGGQFPAG